LNASIKLPLDVTSHHLLRRFQVLNHRLRAIVQKKGASPHIEHYLLVLDNDKRMWHELKCHSAWVRESPVCILGAVWTDEKLVTTNSLQLLHKGQVVIDPDLCALNAFYSRCRVELLVSALEHGHETASIRPATRVEPIQHANAQRSA